MKVERSHKTPLVRQISEGVEIANCKAEIIMNSKGEWNGSRLLKMVIERGEDIEFDEGDIHSRMMNWEKEKKKLEISKVLKRKIVNWNEEGSRVNNNTDEDTVVEEATVSEQRKRIKLDPKSPKEDTEDQNMVPEVRSNPKTNDLICPRERKEEGDVDRLADNEVELQVEPRKAATEAAQGTAEIREVSNCKIQERMRYFGPIVSRSRPGPDPEKEGREVVLLCCDEQVLEETEDQLIKEEDKEVVIKEGITF